MHNLAQLRGVARQGILTLLLPYLSLHPCRCLLSALPVGYLLVFISSLTLLYLSPSPPALPLPVPACLTALTPLLTSWICLYPLYTTSKVHLVPSARVACAVIHVSYLLVFTFSHLPIYPYPLRLDPFFQVPPVRSARVACAATQDKFHVGEGGFLAPQMPWVHVGVDVWGCNLQGIGDT